MNVDGDSLWAALNKVVEDKKLKDKEKLRRIEVALEIYKFMNELEQQNN